MSTVECLENATSSIIKALQSIDKSGLACYTEMAHLHNVRVSLQEILDALREQGGEI
jgi:hypothetical protein